MTTTWSTAPALLESRLDAEFYLPKYLEIVRLIRATGAAKVLGDVEVAGCYGVLPKSEEYGQGSTPLFRGRDLNGQALVAIPDDAPRVPNTYLASKRARLRPNEILLLIKGATIDEPQSVGIVPSSWTTPAIVNGSVYKFGIRAPNDPYYVCAFFGTRYGRGQKTRAIANTGIHYNDQASIRAFWLALPSSAIQRAIGNKVRKAERLRELAAVEWRDAHARLEATLGQPLEPRAFDALNADHLSRPGYRCTSLYPAMTVVSVADEIGAQYFHPRREHARQVASRTGSWQRLDQLARRVRKRGRGIGFLGLDLIDSSTGVVTAASSSTAAEGALFERNDILFSRLRPYLNKVTICTERRGVGSTELLVYRPADGIDAHYLYLVLKCPLGLYQVIDVTSGSTHPRVDEDVVDGIHVPRIGTDGEKQIGDNVRAAFGHWTSAPALVEDARTAIESLIAGTLDEPALLAEGEAIKQWLADHPSPRALEQT